MFKFLRARRENAQPPTPIASICGRDLVAKPLPEYASTEQFCAKFVAKWTEPQSPAKCWVETGPRWMFDWSVDGKRLQLSPASGKPEPGEAAQIGNHRIWM